jgi:hypothetical protein
MLTTKAEITAEESDITRIFVVLGAPQNAHQQTTGHFRVNVLSTKYGAGRNRFLIRFMTMQVERKKSGTKKERDSQ